MSRHHNDMDVGVDDDGEVFVTRNASSHSRQHRQEQQFTPRDQQKNAAGSMQLRHPALPMLFNVSLERVHGLTLTSNAAFSCFAEENLIAYTAGFIVVIHSLRDDRQFFITNHAKKAFTCVAFSNDGRFLATGEAGGAACVRIWSVRECAQLAELKGGHKQSICCVAFSPRNTKYVVSVGGQNDNYIRVWQWRSALAATLAPAYHNKVEANIWQNSPSGGGESSSFNSGSSALVASNKLPSTVTSLAVLVLSKSALPSGEAGDTASSTGHSTNDDALTAVDDDDDPEDNGSLPSDKKTNIVIVTAGVHHLKYWYLDAALQGRGSHQHGMRREAKARQSTTSTKSANNSNILPGKSIKLDEIEYFHSSSLFTFADVAVPSLQPHYVICCTRSPNAALLQFHTGSRRLEKWVELKAAHAYCLAIAPYPFTSSGQAADNNAADTDTAVGIASAQRHNNFDHYQKYEVVFVGCSQGIIRVFDCDTLNVVISSLPRPHWLGITAQEANQKGRPPQPPTLGGAVNPEVVLPASIVYPDCIALRYDAQHQHLAAVYSDHSLYVWDVRRLLSEKRIGKLSSYLAHSRCIWGLDSAILPSISNSNYNPQQQQSRYDTLLASSSSDNTVRLWKIPSATTTSGAASSERLNSKYRQNNDVNNISGPRFELESIIYNTKSVANSSEDEVMDVDANVSTLAIEHLNDAVFDAESNKDTNQGCRCVRLSDDCKLLAAGYRDGNIRVFEIKFNSIEHQMEPVVQNVACNPLCRIEAHESEVLCLQFNSTPHLLASGSRDRLIHIFNVRNEFAYIATIDCHTSSITALQFYFTTYTQSVQQQGGVKGGLPMQRRLYTAAKRHRHHQLLMLATCGLDKQIMFSHVDFGDSSGAGGDDEEYRFEQIDSITTPCAMYDMRLVKRVEKRADNGAGVEDEFSSRGRRPTPAEPYDSSSNSSSPVVPAIAGGLQPRSHVQKNRLASNDFENGQSSSANVTELHTANQDQYVRVFDAVARKWIKSFFIDTGNTGAVSTAKSTLAVAAAPAAIIKLDIARAPSASSVAPTEEQPRLLLAASCSDKTLVLYDAVSGEPACATPFYGHSELVTSLKLIDDGRRLVSAAGDSTLFVWRITLPVPPPSSSSISAALDKKAGTQRRRTATAATTAVGNSPAHTYSMQNLSVVQPKLLPADQSGWSARNRSGLPPAPVRGAARILRANNAGGMQQQQQRQRQYSDESDDDGPQTTSGSIYSSHSTDVASTQQRRRSAAARATATLHHPRMSSQERMSEDRRGAPSWAPRRRVTQSVERPSGAGNNMQPLRMARDSGGSTYDMNLRGRRNNYDNEEDDGDDDSATNAAIGAERRARPTLRESRDTSQNRLLNSNNIATMQRRRNATGNEGIQQQQSPRRGGEPRVPSPSQAALSLQDTLLMLSGRANGGSGLPPRSALIAADVTRQQQASAGTPTGTGNVMYYSVNSDTIRRGTTQQRQPSADHNISGNASVMSTPTSTSTTTSQSSATLRALQATAERRAAAAVAAVGRQSPQSPINAQSVTMTSSSPAVVAETQPQVKSIRAAMEAATSVTSKRRLGQELLGPMMQKATLDDTVQDIDNQQQKQRQIFEAPQPPPRRTISATSSTNAKFAESAEAETTTTTEQEKTAGAHGSGNNDDAVAANIERGGKQRVSLTRRHMKAAKERLASKQQSSVTSSASVVEEAVDPNDEEEQEEYSTGGSNSKSNVSWVAAQRAQLNAQSQQQQQQQQKQYANVKSMFAGELSNRNVNTNKNLPGSFGGGVASRAVNVERRVDTGGGMLEHQRSLGAESPPASTIGSPDHSLSGEEEEEGNAVNMRAFRY